MTGQIETKWNEMAWGNWRRLAWAGAGIAGSSLVFIIDVRIPPEVAISPLYLFPVALVAWRGTLNWAIAVAGVAGAQWIWAEYLVGARYTAPWVYAWNTGMRFGTFAVVAWLVTRAREAHDNYRHLARHDSLTGVLNNRAFHEGLTAEIERARRHGRGLTVVYVDIDNFKLLNDRLGHVTGDAALTRIAGTLSAHTRRNDLVGRVGGDEFAILLTEVSVGGVPDALARLQHALVGVSGAEQWPVSFSLGAVTFERPPDSAAAAVHAADELMYSVKRTGKNSVRHEVIG